MNKGFILAVSSAANFMGIINISIVNVALPSMQQDLHTEMSGLQWVINAFTICLSALMLSGGSLGDRLGRKRVFSIGIAGFILGSVLCALSTSLATLIVGRVVQGLSAALTMPGSLSILTQTFTEPAERARKIGVWASVTAIGLVVGPVLGGFLVQTAGWQSLFWVSVPLGVIAFVGTIVFIPESSDPEHAAIDPWGQILAIAGLGGLSFGLIRLGDHGWGDTIGLVTTLVAVGLCVALVTVEWRQKSPMLPVRMFADRDFAAMNFASASLGFGPYAIYAFLAIYMQQVQDASALATGLAFVPMSVTSALMAPLAGRWAGTAGPVAPMVTGYGVSAVSLAGVMLFDVHTPWWLIGIVFIGIGFGMGLSMTPTTNAAVSAVPRERSGVASATINTTRQTGLAIGVALLGSIVATQSDFVTGLRLAAGITAAVSALAVAYIVWANGTRVRPRASVSMESVG